MIKSMITSTDTVTQVSNKFQKNEKAYKNMGISIRGRKSIVMFRYTLAGMRIVKM